MNRRQRARRIGLQLLQLGLQYLAAAGVFVPQVDPDLADAGAPRGDQHALEEPMRLSLQVPAVLKGAGLAFVDVDGHDARLGLGGDQAPLAPGRESCAAEAAQRRVLHDLGHAFAGVLAGEAVGDQLVAASLAVLDVVDIRLDRAVELLLLHGGAHLVRGGIADRVLPDVHAGRDFAAADARGGNDAHAAAQIQLEELLGAGELAGDRIAYAHGERWRRPLAFLHHFEMMVEGGDLVDLGERNAHLLRQRGEVRGGQMAETVVDAVQVLDQQIAPARRVAEELPHFGEGPGVDRPALRNRPDPGFHGDTYYRPAATRDFLTAVNAAECENPRRMQAAWDALERNDFRFAERAARAALARSPSDPEALYLLGSTLLFEGRFAEARDPLEAAAARLSRRGVRYRLGHCHLALGDPAHAEPNANAAHLLFTLGRPEEALPLAARAIEANPELADAHLHHGLILHALKRYEEAVASFARAYRSAPDTPYALSSLVWSALHCCDWRTLGAHTGSLREQVRAARVPAAPFTLVAVSDSHAEQLQCAARHVRESLPARPPLRRAEPQAAGRIRLAYLSADFHEHATAYLAARLFELHDPQRFELIGVSYGPDDGSATRARLARAFHFFIDAREMSDQAAARLLAELEPAIAVDLKGHTAHARLGILAYRPAAVQVTYLGYPGTSAAPFIDYVIADRVVIRPEDEAFYTEKIAYLPHSYQVNDDSVAIDP